MKLNKWFSAMRWRPHTVILYAFDLMHLNGGDLRHEPLSERRSILQSLIGTDKSRIQFSEVVPIPKVSDLHDYRCFTLSSGGLRRPAPPSVE